MDFNLILPYPVWFIVLCLVLGIVYATILYRNETRFSAPSWLQPALFFLRFLAVSLIAFLLLNPLLKQIEEEIKKPIVVLARDISGSILTGLSERERNMLDEGLNTLKKSVSDKYDVKEIAFGSEVVQGDSDSTYRHSTNIAKALQYISDNYGDQNLGAVIMTTDGIYNEGANPLYSNAGFKAPIYTIALGDTMPKKDLSIQNIFHNRIVYLGDRFSVQIDISAFNCSASFTKLTVEQIGTSGTKLLYDENINITGTDFFTTRNVILDANATGIVRYRVRLTAVSNEVITANNARDFFVEILDARQKILIYANAPHPDISGLKQIILENKNYEVITAFASDTPPDFSAFNLVIFHNLPSDKYDITSVVQNLRRKEIPSIFVVGAQTSTEKFNRVQNVIQIKGNSSNTEEIQGDINPLFSQFTTSETMKSRLRTFPPLITPFGEYSALGGSNVFIYQTIKKIKTNYPLIAFNEESGVRTAVICGEGIWKWRVFDYLQNSNYDLISEIVNKSIQLVSVKSDKRKFRVSTSRNIYRDNDNIVFDAQLYNDAFELVNDPDVSLTVKNESGAEYKYNFSRTQNYYTLNAGLFQEGSYSYTASTSLGGKQYTAQGKFIVESVRLEQYDLTARHALLHSLSERYGGRLFYPAQTDQLIKVLTEEKPLKAVMYQSTTTRPLLNLKWLFFLITGLLFAEWFMRRYAGSY